MDTIPPRAYEIQAGYLLGRQSLQDWVDWAVEAIVAGYDSPSLRILAGLEPPLDELELCRLWNRSFVELGIVPLEKENCLSYYIAATLRQALADDLTKKEALSSLMSLYLERKYDGRLKDFYLLYHAFTDLETSADQWYWKGANRGNITKIIDDYFQDWLKNHCHK